MADKYSLDELKKLTVQELDALLETVAEARKAVRSEAKKELRQRLEALAHEAGYSLEEILGQAQPTPGSKVKLPPKYRNPANPDQTWAGRGMRPKWVEEHLESGRSLEDLKI